MRLVEKEKRRPLTYFFGKWPGKKEELDGINRLIRKDRDSFVSLTTLSLSELLKGAYLAKRKDEALALVNDFVRNSTLLTLTKKSCDLFGMDYAYLKDKGKLTSEFNLLIASVAKAEERILVTRNERHFKNIPDLKLEVW